MVVSTLIYIFCFLSSIGLCYLGENLKICDNGKIIKSNKRIQFILFCFSILIPCFFAGFRSNNVGVDVNVYITPYMEPAYNCKTYWDVYKLLYSDVEYLYVLLLYISSRFTSDSWLLLFSLQLLTILPIFLAAKQLKDKLTITSVFATYLFVYYNNSLNLMRQSVSCAFIILGTVYLIKRSKCYVIKTILCLLTAILFHKSGVIGVFCILVVYIFLKNRFRKPIKVLLTGFILFLPYILVYVFELLASIGILPRRYIIYGDIFLYKTITKNYFVNLFSLYILCNIILSVGIVAIPSYLGNSNQLKKDWNYDFIRFIVFVGLIFYLVVLFSMQTPYGGRISLYFDMFVVLLFPYSLKAPDKRLKLLIFNVFIVLYWFLWIMILGWSGSNYYSFRF